MKDLTTPYLDMQQESGMSVLFITHDLGVVAEVARRVVVMYGAQVLENAPVNALFASPRHPYTSGLLEAMPQVALDRGHAPVAIPGVVAQAHTWPAGCRFHPRCGYCVPAVCADQPVPLAADDPGMARCARSGDLRTVLGQAATERSVSAV